jgi:hypothetical protein
VIGYRSGTWFICRHLGEGERIKRGSFTLFMKTGNNKLTRSAAPPPNKIIYVIEYQKYNIRTIMGANNRPGPAFRGSLMGVCYIEMHPVTPTKNHHNFHIFIITTYDSKCNWETVMTRERSNEIPCLYKFAIFAWLRDMVRSSPQQIQLFLICHCDTCDGPPYGVFPVIQPHIPHYPVVSPSPMTAGNRNP